MWLYLWGALAVYLLFDPGAYLLSRTERVVFALLWPIIPVLEFIDWVRS